MSAMSRYQFATTSKRALFRKVPAPCLCSDIPLLNNWELTEVNGRAVKWVRRTVVEPLLKIYLLTFRWLSPLACHIALSGPVKLWDPLMICQSMIPLTPGHWPTEIGHNQPNTGTISDRSPLSCVMFKTANRPDLTWNLPVTLSRYRFSPYYFGPLRWTYRTISANQQSRSEN